MYIMSYQLKILICNHYSLIFSSFFSSFFSSIFLLVCRLKSSDYRQKIDNCCSGWSCCMFVCLFVCFVLFVCWLLYFAWVVHSVIHPVYNVTISTLFISQRTSATELLESNKGELKTRPWRLPLPTTKSTLRFLVDFTAQNADGTWERGVHVTTTTISGCRWTLDEQWR